MSVEGRVSIDVRRGNIPAVCVSLTQPGDVARVLRGKTSAEARSIIPVLFSVCGNAQAHAARLALDAAQGRAPAAAELAAMQCLTEMESLRENALRIALDWTRQLGERVDQHGLKPLMRLVPGLESVMQSGGAPRDKGSGPSYVQDRALRVIEAAEELLSAIVFGEPLAQWRERPDADAVRAWAEAGQTPAARLLHRIDAQGHADAGAIVLRRLAPPDDDVMRAWLGDGPDAAVLLPMAGKDPVPETTLLSRHADDRRLARAVGARLSHSGLWARLTARLIELSQLPGRMRGLIEGRITPIRGRMIGNAIGVSEIMAARGMLMHVAAVRDGRITRYRVLSPTRWNFDAHGAAARAIESIAAEHGEDAQALAELMVTAIDPCVAHAVRIH